MKFVRFVLLGCLVPLGAALAADASKSAPLFADEVLAKGKGFEIKRSQLDEAVIGFKANAAARGEPVGLSTEELDKRLLDKLITVESLKTRATEEDRVGATNKADKLIAEMQGRATSITAFIRQLQAVGTTPQKFRIQVVDQLVGEQVVEREVRRKIAITGEQAKKFYDENLKQFQTPEMVRASHILFSVRDADTKAELPSERKLERRQTAEKVLARVKAGEDFAKLVKEFSDDPGSKERGGEYTFGRGQMMLEFEAAAFSLTPGQVSDLVTTAYGFHIIKLIERIPAKAVEFEKVEARIKDGLASIEVEKQMPTYLENLRKEAGVEILKTPGN